MVGVMLTWAKIRMSPRLTEDKSTVELERNTLEPSLKCHTIVQIACQSDKEKQKQLSAVHKCLRMLSIPHDPP